MSEKPNKYIANAIFASMQRDRERQGVAQLAGLTIATQLRDLSYTDLAKASGKWALLEAAADDLDALTETMRHMRAELERLRTIEAAARNLAKVNGRHNSEIAMNQLLEALK